MHQKSVAGYDVMNEPVSKDPRVLIDVYRKVTQAIRSVDKNHIIVLEANKLALDFGSSPPLFDKNTIYSFHFFAPGRFTHQRKKGTTYPSGCLDKEYLERFILTTIGYGQKYNVPLYVGAFGAIAECPELSELKWTEDCIQLFEKHNLGWFYFNYKTEILKNRFSIFYLPYHNDSKHSRIATIIKKLKKLLLKRLTKRW